MARSRFFLWKQLFQLRWAHCYGKYDCIDSFGKVLTICLALALLRFFLWVWGCVDSSMVKLWALPFIASSFHRAASESLCCRVRMKMLVGLVRLFKNFQCSHTYHQQWAHRSWKSCFQRKNLLRANSHPPSRRNRKTAKFSVYNLNRKFQKEEKNS